LKDLSKAKGPFETFICTVVDVRQPTPLGHLSSFHFFSEMKGIDECLAELEAKHARLRQLQEDIKKLEAEDTENSTG
jgi:hypothetical protein